MYGLSDLKIDFDRFIRLRSTYFDIIVFGIWFSIIWSVAAAAAIVGIYFIVSFYNHTRYSQVIGYGHCWRMSVKYPIIVELISFSLMCLIVCFFTHTASHAIAWIFMLTWIHNREFQSMMRNETGFADGSDFFADKPEPKRVKQFFMLPFIVIDTAAYPFLVLAAFKINNLSMMITMVLIFGYLSIISGKKVYNYFNKRVDSGGFPSGLNTMFWEIDLNRLEDCGST